MEVNWALGHGPSLFSAETRMGAESQPNDPQAAHKLRDQAERASLMTFLMPFSHPPYPSTMALPLSPSLLPLPPTTPAASSSLHLPHSSQGAMLPPNHVWVSVTVVCLVAPTGSLCPLSMCCQSRISLLSFLWAIPRVPVKRSV